MKLDDLLAAPVQPGALPVANQPEALPAAEKLEELAPVKPMAQLPIAQIPDSMYGPEQLLNPGQESFSIARKLGDLIAYTMANDQHFYLFSPDETTSNKLDASYKVTQRAWAMPQKGFDMPENVRGRIVELLSENTLFAAMVGHIMNGEQAMMTSYESFFSIVSSQIFQHLKFLKQADEAEWRSESLPAINLLSTSTCWRQDHNGFSHQSPALISALLNNPSDRSNCLFPVDDISATANYEFLLNSRNVVNLMTFDKNETPRWIDRNHAKFQFEYGASIFGFTSDENPDYVFTAAGDDVTRETIAAIELLKQDLPSRRFRFIGVNALSYEAIGTTDHKMPQNVFDEYYTNDKPIIANFHGYADAFKNILSVYTDRRRIFAHGFEEQGSTTTPFQMLSLNHASRYDLAIDVARMEGRQDLVEKYEHILQENTEYAHENGEDKIKL